MDPQKVVYFNYWALGGVYCAWPVYTFPFLRESFTLNVKDERRDSEGWECRVWKVFGMDIVILNSRFIVV